MRKIAILLLMTFMLGRLCAQTAATGLGESYEKVLNSEEASYFKGLFEKDSFSFENKKVGFAYYNYLLFITDKHHYFNEVKKANDIRSVQLLVLSESEKKQAGGYDAIIFTVTKSRKKLKTSREEIVEGIGKREYYHTHDLATRYYPDNLSLLGLDDDPVLSSYESTYFNSVHSEMNKGFDFTNKKIAYFSGLGSENERTKSQYFNYRKDALSKGWWQGVGTLVILDAKQKEETGGYDAIITFQAKMYYLKDMIAALKKKSAGQ